MTKTIWKYEIPIIDHNEIQAPESAKPLCVQMQNGRPMLWMLVDPDEAAFSRVVRWYGTGQPCDPVGEYVGTVQKEGLVFHCWVER